VKDGFLEKISHKRGRNHRSGDELILPKSDSMLSESNRFCMNGICFRAAQLPISSTRPAHDPSLPEGAAQSFGWQTVSGILSV
jgi:hypothetical protein